jgi:hypothetical protein
MLIALVTSCVDSLRPALTPINNGFPVEIKSIFPGKKFVGQD